MIMGFIVEVDEDEGENPDAWETDSDNDEDVFHRGNGKNNEYEMPEKLERKGTAIHVENAQNHLSPREGGGTAEEPSQIQSISVASAIQRATTTTAGKNDE